LVALQHDLKARDLGEVVKEPDYVDGSRRPWFCGSTHGPIPAVAQETDGLAAGTHIELGADQVAGLQGEHYAQD